MIEHDNEPDDPKYFIASYEKAEFPYTGPGSHRPADMDIKLRLISQPEKLCGKPEPL